MGATLRPCDAFGRYGGEEMLVVLPDCDVEGALEVAERMRAAVATGFGDIATTVSIGVASVGRQDTATLGALLQRADQALYRAKANGRNCITIAS